MFDPFTSHKGTPVRVYTQADVDQAKTSLETELGRHTTRLADLKSVFCASVDAGTIYKSVDEIRVQDIIAARGMLDACSTKAFNKAMAESRKSVEQVYDALGLYLETFRSINEGKSNETPC